MFTLELTNMFLENMFQMEDTTQKLWTIKVVMPLLGALDAMQPSQDMSPKAINADFAWSRISNGSKVLRKGHYGLEVEALQPSCKNCFNIERIDGDFGNGTRQEVIKFQSEAGQIPDGVVGQKQLPQLMRL